MEMEGHAPGVEETIQDPVLLMEVMEVRERVEDTSDPEELTALAKEYLAREDELVDQLSDAFARRAWLDVHGLVHRLTYVERVLEVIKEKQ